MAIYRLNSSKNDLEVLAGTTLKEQDMSERELQTIVRDRADILESGLFIIDEEYGNWQGSGRRIDLLGLDTTGNLVVVELKRNQSEHMDLQAVRYAAMVANFTFDQLVKAHQAYLGKRGKEEEDALEKIREHLEKNQIVGDQIYTEQPRIILVAGDFEDNKELTTSVLWLNQSGLDIKCVQLRLFKNAAEILVEFSQVIPLPGTEEYIIRIRERDAEVRQTQNVRGQDFDGSSAFLDSISTASERFQPNLRRLHDWATDLEKEGLATLTTYQSGNSVNLQVRLPQAPNRPALITVNNGSKLNSAFIRFYLTQLNRYALQSISLLEELTGLDFTDTEKKGNVTRSIVNINDELLMAICDAYREANGRLSSEEQASEELQTLAE